MGKSKLSAAFLLFLLLLAGKPAVSQGHEPAPSVALPLQTGPGYAWMSECVDCHHAFQDMGPRSLALDAEGRPAIAFHDAGADDMRYVWYDGNNWQVELVDARGITGWYPSLALDSQESPHVAYHSFTTQDLRYASRKILPFQWGLPLVAKTSSTFDIPGNRSPITDHQ